MNTIFSASLSSSASTSAQLAELEATDLAEVVGGGLTLGATVSREGGMTVTRDISTGEVISVEF